MGGWFCYDLKCFKRKSEREEKSTVVCSIDADWGEKWALGRHSWEEKEIHRNTPINLINAFSLLHHTSYIVGQESSKWAAGILLRYMISKGIQGIAASISNATF